MKKNYFFLLLMLLVSSFGWSQNDKKEEGVIYAVVLLPPFSPGQWKKTRVPFKSTFDWVFEVLTYFIPVQVLTATVDVCSVLFPTVPV